MTWTDSVVARAIQRVEARAAEALPPDIAIERNGDGIRLTGPRLRMRWATELALRHFWRAG